MRESHSLLLSEGISCYNLTSLAELHSLASSPFASVVIVCVHTRTFSLFLHFLPVSYIYMIRECVRFYTYSVVVYAPKTRPVLRKANVL